MAKFNTLNYKFDSSLNRKDVNLFILNKSFEELLSEKINKEIYNALIVSLYIGIRANLENQLERALKNKLNNNRRALKNELNNGRIQNFK